MSAAAIRLTAPAPSGFAASLPWLWRRVLFPGRPAAVTPLRWPSLLLVLLAPALLLYPCRSFHLLEPDEGRYAQIPAEMLAAGDWVVPTLQGQPYLDKPPLLYWLVMASYQLFGVTDAAARVPPALAAHGCVLLAYFFGRRWLGERSALTGAMLLTAAPGFLCVGRLLVLDGLLAFCVTLSWCAAFEAVRTGRLLRGWWTLAAVACGLGVLTKGPVAVILLAGPVLTYAALQPTAARPGVRAWLALAAAVLAVNLPWYVAVALREPVFLKYFLWDHNVVRFLSPFDHIRPVWFYGPVVLVGLFPATLWLGPALRFLFTGGRAAASWRSPELGFALLAGGWCVLFFSLSGCKLPTYVLPAFPMLALATGHFLAHSRWRHSRLPAAAVAGSLVVVGVAHYAVVPWYAEQRSPALRPDVLVKYVADPANDVVCFPRGCDSVAFYTGRTDLRNVRSKHTASLIQDLLERPRTVVLLTHRSSLGALREALADKPVFRIREAVSMRRPFGFKPLDFLAGETPWGLCDVAVVERAPFPD